MPSGSPIARCTGSPPASGPRTSRRRTAWLARSRRGPCGSTPTTSTIRRRRSAATSSPDSAAIWANRRWTTTPRPRRCGSVCDRRVDLWRAAGPRGEARGRPRDRPCRRSRGDPHQGARRALGHRPTVHRRRDPRLHQSGRRGQPQRGAHGAAARGVARGGPGPDGEPAVRLRTPGRGERGAGDQGRRGAGVRGRWGREHDPRALRDAESGRAVEPQAARDRGHHGRMALHEPAAPPAVDHRARGDGRGRGAAQTRVPRRWHRHGRERERDQRRRRGTLGDGTGGGRGRERTRPARAHRRHRGGGRRPELHGTRTHPRDAEGARARRHDHRPDRPGRAERGVRRPGARLHPRAPARPGDGEHLRRGDRARPPAGRDRCPDPDHPGARPRADPIPLRLGDDVHRRGSGHRHDRGARLVAAYDRVLVEIGQGLATVTLNRPEKLNAFDRALCDELVEALALVSQSAGVRVIVITGAGRAFCAGADLAALGAEGTALVAAGKSVVVAIRTAPQPVLAAVNGPAAGGGANLALACDYRIASDQASIGQVFGKLGLVPDWGGTYFLPRLVGTAKALELVWSARMVGAPEALALGLFDRVVPPATLLTEARALAATWAAQPAGVVRRAKAAVYQSGGSSLRAMLDLEIEQQNELFATPEARARIGASLAKRSH